MNISVTPEPNLSNLDYLFSLNKEDFPLTYKPKNLHELIQMFSLFTPLINRVPSIVFFIKDEQARYVIANETLAKRCGFDHVNDILGKTSYEVFDAVLGKSYMEQDLVVLKQGQKIYNRLELHSYSTGAPGWCITHKIPIYNVTNHIVGMMGISIDIQSDEENQPKTNERIYKVEKYIRQYFDQAISMSLLAELAELSVSQLDRTFKKLFHMTPSQFIQKIRLEHAVKLLQQDCSITEISALCGYSDHSAFSRKFKQLTGTSPRQFKARLL